MIKKNSLQMSTWQPNEGMLMKSPLWILNSSLVLLLGIILGVIFFMRVDIPGRKSLTPQAIAPVQQDVSKVNTTRIYESDLFNTYIKPSTTRPIPPSEAIKFPKPPTPKTAIQRQRPVPEFLQPLEVDLKGVIFNSNSIYSRAIVADRKNKKENLYKIGDSIADANLIYIGKNKAIFIRSNGQQETLFVTEEDAKNDPIYGGSQEWKTAVEKIDDHTFIINTEPFKKQVTNLAQLLDILDITTAFAKGKSIGCRVGRMTGNLGQTLGLKHGDVIISINNTPTTSTSDRVTIYKEIEQAENNQRIPVAIQREGAKQKITYILRKRIPKRYSDDEIKTLPAGSPIKIDNKQIVTKAQKDIAIAEQTLSQSQVNDALAETFRKNDKKAMLEYGGRNAVLRR